MSWNFGAGNQGVTVETSAGLSGFPVTLACWFNVAGTNSQAMFSLADSAGNNNYSSLEILAGGTCRCLISGTPVETTSNYSIDTWTHLCAVHYSNTEHVIFFNGVRENSNDTSRTLGSLDRVGLGYRARNVADGHYTGKLAECAIWQVGLGADDVASLATGRAPSDVQPQYLRIYRDLLTDLFSPNIGPASISRTGADSSLSGLHPPIWGRPNMTRRVALLAPQAVAGVTMPRFYHHYQRNTG